MTRQYLLKKGIVGIGIVTILILLITTTNILHPLTQALGWIATPLLSWKPNIFDRKPKESKEDIETLKQQKEILTRENNDLLKERAELYTLREQVVQLKQELDTTSTWQRNVIHAEVVGREEVLPAAGVIINKGLLQGLKSGWLVTTQGALIGVINKVGETTSLVRLLNHPDSAIPARLASQPSLIAIAHGTADLSINLDLIPQSVSISDVEIVVSAPIGPYAEQDIPLGRVIKQTTHTQGLFQTLHITPFVDYRSLRMITIIVPAQL